MNYLAALALIGSADFNSILDCILTIESNNVVNIVSRTGDYGIGQVNKRSWPQFDYGLMLSDRDYSISAAKQVLVYTESKVGYKAGWPCAYNVGLRAFKLGTKPTACKAYNFKLAKCLKGLKLKELK